jgi:hypothetical protein
VGLGVVYVNNDAFELEQTITRRCSDYHHVIGFGISSLDFVGHTLCHQK